MFEPIDSSVEFKTQVPFTYNIDYAADHVGNEDYVKMIAEAPPVLLHVGHDVPFKSMYGPADLYDPLGHRRLSPEEVRARMEKIRDHVDQLHRAGATIVIPYICSMFLFGNKAKRKGFWSFYDNWDKYSEFGFGTRPSKDPITWNCTKPRSLKPLDKSLDEYVYEPCINQPEWRRFLRGVVGLIAKVGYDGVFSDVNASSCEKACCRKLFAEYLSERYTKREINELFGFDGPGKVRMGKVGEGLLWFETVRFRGERMAKLFAEFRNEGRKHRDTFIVVPNLSPFQHVDGVWRRIGNTHVFASWARECPVIMYEEMNQPGLFGPGVVSNFTMQYKYAFAHTSRAGCLLYGASDPEGVHIAIAEAAAGGGGALIQGRYSCPEIRREFRTFFVQHTKLFEGFTPCSKVGLLFFYDQLAWGTRRHIECTYRIAEELMSKHVLFDLVVERGLRPETLGKYDLLIASDLENLSDLQTRAMLGYVEEGGRLLAFGKFGSLDERGKRRRGGALGAIPKACWESHGKVDRASYGKGECLRVATLDDLLSPAHFELFMLSEEECNSVKKIIELLERPKEGSGERQRQLLPAMGDRSTSVYDGEETLRFNAYLQANVDESQLTLHAVNYNLPIRGMGQSGPVVPVKNVRIILQLPTGFEADSLELYNPPEMESVSLPFHHGLAGMAFEIPRIEIYSLASIHLTKQK